MRAASGQFGGSRRQPAVMATGEAAAPRDATSRTSEEAEAGALGAAAGAGPPGAAASSSSAPPRAGAGEAAPGTLRPQVLGAAAEGAGQEPGAAAAAAASFPGNERPPLTREELLEQGLQPDQVDAMLARQYQSAHLMQNAHLMQSFRCWIFWFSVLICILTPVMIGLLFWLLVAYSMNYDKKCDVPLRLWCDVVYGVAIFNATLNKPTPRGSLVVRYICRWRRDPMQPSPLPLRIRAYNAMVTLLIFAWNCLGLHWVRKSGSIEDPEHPSCTDVAPNFVKAVEVYATFNMAFTIFLYINMVGVAHMLRAAVRRGLLRTSQAAPRGAMEKNTTLVQPDDPVLASQPACSICLEEFDLSSRPAVKTNVCEHIFCKQCLQGWLRVGRFCPLCRADLGSVE